MIQLLAPAKLNLYLAILEREASGFHRIETVLAKLPELFDVIEIEPANEFSVEMAGVAMEDNLITKAVRAFEAKTGRKFELAIRVDKRIPMGAGLGGGSSDAGVVLRWLNKEADLSEVELLDLAAEVGSDVPFFVSDFKVALGTHHGEKLQALPELPQGLSFEFLEGPFVSTAEAYAEWDQKRLTTKGELTPVLRALENGDAEALIVALHNDFEQLIPPQISESGDRVLLAGSGGACFVVRKSVG